VLIKTIHDEGDVMTFQEAHATGKEYRPLGSDRDYLRIYDGRYLGDYRLQEMLGDWEVEPEVYEVECTWECDVNKTVYPCSCKGVCFSGKLGKSLIGKRTKLTIEVLD
jgi:hypothetical protein